GRSDGQMLAYLDKPQEYRLLAPELFDFLHHCVRVKQDRRIACLEATGLLPWTIYFSRFLSDDNRGRKAYFAQMLRRFALVDLIFFDPDNGLEIKSRPSGRKESSKYLYWCELQRAYESGHSVLVYQHFTRENRANFIQRI